MGCQTYIRIQQKDDHKNDVSYWSLTMMPRKQGCDNDDDDGDDDGDGDDDDNNCDDDDDDNDGYGDGDDDDNDCDDYDDNDDDDGDDDEDDDEEKAGIVEVSIPMGHQASSN